MRRVSVVGNSGSGKTTLARELSGRLGVPFVELDAIQHQPGWRPLPTEEFRERVAAVVAGEAGCEKDRRRYAAASGDSTYAHLSFIRLGSRAEADRLLSSRSGE